MQVDATLDEVLEGLESPAEDCDADARKSWTAMFEEAKSIAERHRVQQRTLARACYSL